jgi:hypothetical protein
MFPCLMELYFPAPGELGMALAWSLGIVSLTAQAAKCSPDAAPEGDGAPELPEEAVFKSYKLMMAGAGFEPPDPDAYKAGVQALLSVLRESGWTVCRPASDIPHPRNKANLAQTGNTSSVREVNLDSEELHRR